MERPLTDLTRSIKRNDLHIALQKLERYGKIPRIEPIAQARSAIAFAGNVDMRRRSSGSHPELFWQFAPP
ncbi:hypothetical protein [Novosphingobium barchaimii]|uniref:hypothetical protein n=1 Tax=Novosphingobium barchaimii TaxID=1420591 RepID=UPI000AC3D442|nr:hypothetical protein [Novosphingobium barchaimii]